MKKILVVLMALVLCLAALVACDNGKQPEVTYDAASAASYVFNLYKDNTTKNEDFEVTATVQVGGVAYDVEWTASEGATVTKKDDTIYFVKRNSAIGRKERYSNDGRGVRHTF